MSEAPERIWVKTRGVPKYYEFPCKDLPLLVEYVRADRIEELKAKLAEVIALIRKDAENGDISHGAAQWVIDTILAAQKGQDDE